MAFRHAIENLAPWWLKVRAGKSVGAKLLYLPGLLFDAFAEHLTQAALVSKPGLGTPTALPLIARDRRIRRGIQEAHEAYAARTLPWLDHHRIRGNPFPLLKNIRGYCNAAVRVRTVDRNGNWFTLERDGSTSYVQQRNNWDWDGVPATPDWSRFWVIIYPTSDGKPWNQGTGPIGNASLWGGAIGNQGYTIGTSATPQQVRDIQAIVEEWRGVGRCERIIIAFDDASFNPAAAGASGMPAGNWGTHFTSSGSPRGPVRLSTARYWPGRAT